MAASVFVADADDEDAGVDFVDVTTAVIVQAFKVFDRR